MVHPINQKERVVPVPMVAPQRMTQRQGSRNTPPTHHPHPQSIPTQLERGQYVGMAEQGRTPSHRRQSLPVGQQQGQGQAQRERERERERDRDQGGQVGALDYTGQVGRDRAVERGREREVKYVVYLKLPFPRAGFVDPPQVDWDRNKERVLWRILSRTTRNQGIDWNHLAQQFQVSRAFLLQQAAWLYERELSQVRAQMRKGVGGAALSNISAPGGTTGGSSPRPISPAPVGIGIVGGTRMARTGSGGSYEPPKTYSQFSLRGVAAAVVAQATQRPIRAGTSTQPIAQPMSRTPSTATARPSSQASLQPPARFVNPILHQQQQILQQEQEQLQQYDLHNSAAAVAAATGGKIYSSTSSSGDVDDDRGSDSDDSATELSKQKGKGSSGVLFDENEEEEEGFYLPFSRARVDSSASMDEGEPGTATLREVKKRKSSVGDAGGPVAEPARQDVGNNPRTNSKRHPSEASSTSTTRQGHVVSAVAQRKLTASGGAESSPSMGSSFSDLSDASISQSAMEDAYLSNMRAAGVASRMSMLGLGLGR